MKLLLARKNFYMQQQLCQLIIKVISSAQLLCFCWSYSLEFTI